MHAFQVDYEDHSFQQLYDTLKKFYPVDAPSNGGSNIDTFAGFDELARIVSDNFVNQSNYRERWTPFLDFLRTALQVPVRATLNLFNVCYSGEMIVDQKRYPGVEHTKSLHFFISTLGPYFSIVALDSTEVTLPMMVVNDKPMDINLPAYHALTVSPVFEYEAHFKTLEAKIREWFPSHRFVPYSVGLSKVKGITRDRDKSPLDNTVYEGIFGSIPFLSTKKRGDERYGFADWIKPLSPGESDLMNLLLEHILQAGHVADTLHKVWRLAEYTVLDGVQQQTDGMFGMDLFEIVDLTDPRKAILMVKDGRAPSAAMYHLAGNVVVLSEQISLRIIELAGDFFRAVLTIDLRLGDRHIQGDVLAMRFTALKQPA